MIFNNKEWKKTINELERNIKTIDRQIYELQKKVYQPKMPKIENYVAKYPKIENPVMNYDMSYNFKKKDTDFYNGEISPIMIPEYEIITLKDKIKCLEFEKKAAEDVISCQVAQIQKLEQNYKALESKYVPTRENISNVFAENNRLLIEKNDLVRQVGNLEYENKKLGSENYNLKTQVANWNRDFKQSQLELENDILRKENNKLITRADNDKISLICSIMNDLGIHFPVVNTTFKNDNEFLQIRINDLKNGVKSLVYKATQKLSLENTELREQIGDLKSKLDHVKQEAQNWETAFQNQQQTNCKLQKQIDDIFYAKKTNW